MDRRAFHKLMTTAVIGNSIGPIFVQETGSGLDIPLRLDSVEIEPAPKEPLAIRGRKQLFVDRYIIAHTDEVLFTLMSPQKYPGNPLLTADVPSDGQVIIPKLVRWDEQKELFQLWYYALHFFESKGEQALHAYAESGDGLHWRRPELGVCEFNGSLANNLVEGTAGMLIFDTHETNPNRRYKGVGYGQRGVTIWLSGDGIHWSPSAKNPVLAPAGDTHSLLGWDERSKKYIGYFRPLRHPETTVHRQLREIGISFSDDAENWTPITPIIMADAHDPPGTEFYWLHATPYEDVYLGILSVLHLDANVLDTSQLDAAGQEQTVDMQLVCSRDGIHWNRMGNRAPWLPLGPYQSWDDQNLWPSVPISVGDEIRLYYAGSSLRHNLPDIRAGLGKKFEGRTRIGGIGLATLRRDGWVAARPNLHRRGVLTTRSFLLEGAALELNVEASKGKILVELLGADAQPLPGFAGAEAPSVAVNSVRHRVKWGRPLAELRGQALCLRFTLEDADLYAFQFTT